MGGSLALPSRVLRLRSGRGKFLIASTNATHNRPHPERSRRTQGAVAIALTPIALFLRGLIGVYQLFISPLLLPSCRFEPSCSHYAQEAIAAHGPFYGLVLTVKRLLRCHPWGGNGYDPVPPHSDH